MDGSETLGFAYDVIARDSARRRETSTDADELARLTVVYGAETAARLHLRASWLHEMGAERAEHDEEAKEAA